MSATVYELLAREIVRLLEPVDYVLENPRAMERLLAAVGVTSPNDEHVALTNALSAVGNLKIQIAGMAARSSPSLGDI